MRCTLSLRVAVVVVLLASWTPAWARQPAPPVIHRATVQAETGILTISGAHLGPDLHVTVDGQPVTVLPGATDAQVEVAAPVSLLTTPGTYRLTVVDPVRRAWDGFVVSALAPVVVAPGASAGATSVAGSGGPSAASGDARVAVPDPAVRTIDGPRPLTVIEDPASPFRTAIGSQALAANTTGTNNTAAGFRAMALTTTGGFNTALGAEALEANTTGIANTAIGRQALNTNTASHNTAVGQIALFAATGSSNTAVGSNALVNLTTGRSNTAIGAGAGRNTTTGNWNIYVGAETLGPDTNTIRIGAPYDPSIPGAPTGQNATFISGIRGTTVSGGEGVYIDAAGRLGSGPVVPAANTVGTAQVIDASLTAADLGPNAVGTSELGDDVVTAGKVAFNYAASTSEGGDATGLTCAACVAANEVGFSFAGLGANAFAGTQQIGVGNLDLVASSTTGGNVTKNGVRFLHNAGVANTFLGEGAGDLGVTGTGNTAIGAAALGAATSGARNVALGANAGVATTMGSDNIFVGAGVAGTAADANTMRLGLPFDATTGEGQNKTFIAGIAGTVLTTPAVPVFVDANGQLGTLTPPPITGTISGSLGANPSPDAELQRAIAAHDSRLSSQEGLIERQQAIIAELQRRLAELEARLPRDRRR